MIEPDTFLEQSYDIQIRKYETYRAVYDKYVLDLKPTGFPGELGCEFRLGHSTFLKVFYNTLSLDAHALIGFHRYNFEAKAKIDVL